MQAWWRPNNATPCTLCLVIDHIKGASRAQSTRTSPPPPTVPIAIGYVVNPCPYYSSNPVPESRLK